MSSNSTTHRWRRWLAAGSAAAAAAVGVGLIALPAKHADAAAQRVNLRVLVISKGDTVTDALATQLDRQGVPFTKVDTTAAGRTTITPEFLTDTATGTAKFQGVIIASAANSGLAPTEVTALNAYQAANGIRQISGYDWPNPALGLNTPTYSGVLDGATATVAAAGLSGPFGYLKGSFAVDDFDPAVTEVYGYLATPATLPAGESFTPLITATKGAASGVLAGVYTHAGREELVVPAAYNAYQQWFAVMGPGMISWLTRGIHLGYQRNYFAVHVDDVFLPDSRWSVTGNCTPGDDCVDPATTTTDIRMTAADVTKLVNWQNANGFKLDMVFNGGGAEAAKAANGGSDPLTDAFLANKSQFPWINHTLTHPYLGCIQIAPTVSGQPWHCATSQSEQPRQDAEIEEQQSGSLWFASQAFITGQVADNIAWANTNGLPNFDPKELVTGEHSGLMSSPQMAADNPFLAPALRANSVTVTASDASRESDPRQLSGGGVTTLPRHPMNIYYNAGTYQDMIDEYNWYYTSRANGGGGICENNPLSTCIAPLAASNNTTAKTSYDNYLKPMEIRNALKWVLTNDPRPFYAHQSNLAEDGILYPVVQGVLDFYKATYDAAKAPIVRTTMTAQLQALQRMSAWKLASSSATGYIDASGVHVPSTGGLVPLTVPTGTTGVTGLAGYAGSLSGWVNGGTAVPPTPMGGYQPAPTGTVPGAPTLGTVSPGNGALTARWTAPAADGGSPLTGFTVRVYSGTSTTVTKTVTAAASATSVVVPGLTNGTAYQVDVVANNSAGAGPASARSASVTPSTAFAEVPANVTPTAGNASATVTWVAPSDTTGITGYRVRAYVGNSTTAAFTRTVGATVLDTTFPALANGTGYQFDVTAQYGTDFGPASRTATVTPALRASAPGAPTVTGTTRTSGTRMTVTFAKPVKTGGQTITGYRVSAFVGDATTGAIRTSVGATATTATVTGLSSGSGYTVQVQPIFSTGTGAASARTTAVTLAAMAPASPTIGTATARRSGLRATVTWRPPASAGSSAISGYRVNALQLDAGGAVVSTTTSPVVAASRRSYVMTLPRAGTYAFTVTAVSAVGDGPDSARTAAVTVR